MNPLSKAQKVIVIGAGFHGLITAGLLAKSGISVQVVETDADYYAEFHKGFKTGPCTHLPIILPYHVVDDLALESHGLDLSTLKPTIFCPYGTEKGAYFQTENPFEKLPFHDSLVYLESTLQQLEDARPPYKEKAWRDTWGTFELGRLLASSDDTTQKIFADSASMSLHGLLEKTDLSDGEKGLIGAMALMASRTDPMVKGSACALIPAYAPYNTAGRAYTITGGLHGVMKCLKQAAMSLGVNFVEGQKLTSTEIEGGKIKSLVLDGGENMTADYFVVDSDPVEFFNTYVDPQSFPPAFKSRIAKDQFVKETVHLKLAVSELPKFTCFQNGDDAGKLLSGQIIIAPNVNYLTKARTDMHQDGGSQLPVISMIIPSLDNPSLAFDNRHSISVMAQYFATDLPNDKETKDAIILACIQSIDEYAPGFAEKIVHCEVSHGTDLTKTHSQFGQPYFSGNMPLLQLFKTYFGHHALGYDLPVSNMVMAGYGCEASSKPHILHGGQMAANLLQSILKSDKE